MTIVLMGVYTAHMKQNTVLDRDVETERYIDVIFAVANGGFTMININ
tara:strand:- start:67 stop:207 length:141 start_codon:yes stop_codon:yes gene_type:complete